jgi:hypothetical protein
MQSRLHRQAGYWEDRMTYKQGPEVIAGGAAPGRFDMVCSSVQQSTEAKCAAVIVIGGECGSGYSIAGSFDAQLLLPDILRKMADVLEREQALRRQ